jgi:uncharacterized protein
MARYEVSDPAQGAFAGAEAHAEIFFQLGMKYSIGRDVSVDYVEAHKWFNLAAMRGNRSAAAYRQELAGEMSPGQIADAQRAARDYLRAH